MADVTSITPLNTGPLDPGALAASQAAGKAAGKDGDAKVKHAAKQFEAMFMTEMVHFARPEPKAGGMFAAGDGEKTWGVFMDQALGQAAANGLGPQLTHAIEGSLKAAQNPRKTETK